MLDYNLLVSFRPGKEKEAEDEIVKRSMDAGETVEDWNVSMDPQLYLVRMNGDAKKAVQKIIRLAEHFPDVFAYTLQWIPVDEWIPSDIETVKSAVNRYAEQAENAGVDVKMLHTCSSDAGRMTEMFEGMSQKGSNERIVVRAVGDTASISLLKDDEMMDINEIRERTGMRAV